MFNGPYRRLALGLLLVFIIKGSYLIWTFQQSYETAQQEVSQQLNLRLADFMVKDIGILSEDGTFDQQKLKEAFRRVMLIAPATELYILNPQGKILTYDAPTEKVKRSRIDLAPIKKFLNKEELPILGDDPRTQWKMKVFSVAEIFDKDKQLKGYLYIILGGEDYDTIATNLSTNKVWDLSLQSIISALVFLLVASLILFYAMTRPLNRLSKDVAEFEKSGFTKLVSTETTKKSNKKINEIQQLRQSFQRMGKQIVSQLKHLKKQDKLRREFLAYVSHDLRTPLAGMRAYLETLSSKHNTITPEERQEFIDNALLNNHRLGDMIDELFELARLDHGEIEIHQESFFLADLLSDLYASLSAIANEKGIHLVMDCPDMSLNVYADVARLERILQNLISNAIYYTPTGGTVTTLISQKQNNTVEISIQDTGKGIPETELAYIFEPYYRALDGKKTRQDGCGLGLAITQRLLALHDSTLHVESKEGVGTRFYFSLRIKE